MAHIDYITGNRKQLIELKDFLRKNNKKMLKENMVDEECFDDDTEIDNLVMYSEKEDMWLLQNCKLEWLQKRLKFMYNIKGD